MKTKFINRERELNELETLERGGIVVVFGRRRIGKTRLLEEFCKNNGFFLPFKISLRITI